jgi:hypothetical protein
MWTSPKGIGASQWLARTTLIVKSELLEWTAPIATTEVGQP